MKVLLKQEQLTLAVGVGHGVGGGGGDVLSEVGLKLCRLSLLLRLEAALLPRRWTIEPGQDARAGRPPAIQEPPVARLGTAMGPMSTSTTRVIARVNHRPQRPRADWRVSDVTRPTAVLLTPLMRAIMTAFSKRCLAEAVAAALSQVADIDAPDMSSEEQAAQVDKPTRSPYRPQ